MLSGKTAIITGGSRGIGAAIAVKFASMGANIAVLFAGNQEAAEAVCQTCRQTYGVQAKAYRCDVASFEETKAAAAAIKADFGTVHILVNNAGITRDGLLAMMKEEAYDAVLDTNLQGAFNMTRHVTPLFLRAKEGCIINISSVSGLMGNAGQCNYAASKAGLIGLTKSVARELAPRGVTCNAVAPGFIETDMTENLHDSPLAASIPLGRMGKPEEVAETVAFLAQSAYITGEVIKVDGGIAM